MQMDSAMCAVTEHDGGFTQLNRLFVALSATIFHSSFSTDLFSVSLKQIIHA
jgi:hypothetical protein